MAETLLSPSNVLLFGRKVDDLNIVEPLILPPGVLKNVKAASTAHVDVSQALTTLDGITVSSSQKVLLKDQNDPTKNGIYKLNGARIPQEVDKPRPKDEAHGYFNIVVQFGAVNGGKTISLASSGSTAAAGVDSHHNPFAGDRLGLQSQTEQQLAVSRAPSFARIYGFSFEGVFYELPRPVLFLVHGDGLPATEMRPGLGAVRAARAPGDPSLTGIGAADFQFSDDVMVWSYDKSDYTIRMDVETGMFEDVLLDAVLGGGSDGMDARGMNARGMNARGMNARGMNARGMNARGMNARGNSD